MMIAFQSWQRGKEKGIEHLSASNQLRNDSKKEGFLREERRILIKNKTQKANAKPFEYHISGSFRCGVDF
eukprot:1235375-Amphidinium_carterae.1